MKKHVLVVGFLLSISFAGAVQAQNKTLGVGVASPNPNAALHVESPTVNQGFIMPRMTTAQRTNPGFVSALSSTDIGLMVFDIDMVRVFTWDGSQWDDSSVDASTTGAGSAGSFSVNNAGNSGAALYATTNGTGPATTSAAIMGETATAFSAVTGIATGPGGSNAVSGISSSSNAFSFGVYGNNTGAGLGGMFQISNASNTSNALEANTNGTGGAAKFKVTNASSVMPALWAETNSNQPLSAPIFGLNTGTGDVAASFRINNATSAQPALFVETNGTGRGAFIRRTSTTGSSPGLYVTSASGHGVWSDHNGTSGYAGIFQNINTANTSAGIMAESIGTGPSMWAIKSTDAVDGNAFNALNEIATGGAIYAEIVNASNSQPSIHASTAGTGAAIHGVTSTGFTAIHGRREGTSNGNAGLFEVTGTSNSYSALQVFTTGTGSGANFEVNNASSGAPGVYASTNGLGSSFIANHTGSSGAIATFQNSGSNVARIDKTGQGFFNGGTQNSGADLAEMFDVEGSKNEYEPGDVLVISEDTDRTVEKSDAANSTRVAGVYATKPGVILTEKNLDESLDALVPMGVVGVIPTKVCLENGAIKRGDLLVTSSRKGHAMKAIPANINGVLIYPTGAILGKALENFDGSETGLIKVLVNVK